MGIGLKWCSNGEGQGSTDGELVKSFRASGIFKNYRIKEGIRRRATAKDSANQAESDLQGQ